MFDCQEFLPRTSEREGIVLFSKFINCQKSEPHPHTKVFPYIHEPAKQC